MNTPYFNNFMPQPGQFGMPQMPGALAQVTTTAADNAITLPVSAVIQAAPAAPGNKVALTWVTSAAGTLINASETVSRIV